MAPVPKVVLCVDDEEVILRLLQAVLESHAYASLTAKNRRDALELARTRPLAAVIIDYVMPDTTGEDLANEIRQVSPGVPIIMFSGSLDVPSHTLISVDAFVPKGEGFGGLLKALHRLIQPLTSESRAARKFPRYAAELPFAVIVERGGAAAMLRGMTTTISEGGIGGKVDADLITGESVLLQISDLQLEMTLEKRAEVRYGAGGRYGFAFLEPNQADVRRMCRRFATG